MSGRKIILGPPPGAALDGSALRRTGGGSIPAGYSRSTISGEPITYNGWPVYDNGVNIIYIGA